MPDIDPLAPQTSVLTLGSSIKMMEPSQEALPSTEGVTSAAKINNESTSSIETADEAALQEEQEDSAFVSGSAKARKLGESRRKLAGTLLESASQSEVARDNFKKLVEEDKDLDKYFRKHFPKQYSQTLEDQPEAIESLDKDTFKQAARAELLLEEIREEKEELTIDLAKRLKFTQLEAEELQDMAVKLEGTKIGGKELDWDEALKRAARIIRPDKAKVGLTSLPSGKGADRDAVTRTQADHERLADTYRDVTGIRRDKQVMLKNLQTVDQGWNAKENKFVMPLN